jgi:flagellar basal body rod protein FlgF
MKYTLIAEDEYGGSKTTREFTDGSLKPTNRDLDVAISGNGFFINASLVRSTPICELIYF